MKNIYVVGGGTAGWLTALFAKKKMPDSNVTVIESESIGILGAGEGTTPNFVEFLDLLEIPISRLITHADATLKHGIKFSGWGREDHYYHGFLSSNGLGLHSLDSPLHLPYTNVLAIYLAKKGISANKVNFPLKAGEQGKVCFGKSKGYSEYHDPNQNYVMKSNFAIHMNAEKLADLLKHIAIEERGVSRIEGLVSDVSMSEDGVISSLQTKDGRAYECDFVFDCTGFSRVFGKGIYNSSWISYKDYLTVDSAQTFFLPIEESIPSYTESIAMSNGWAWKIPLQTRNGCGYVFDSKKISQEEVLKEISSVFGEKVVFGRKISFEPGYLKSQWNKNCISVGLSSGFVEPLEATSIWTSIVALKRAFFDIRSLSLLDDSYIKSFNSYMETFNEEVLAFVYLHYVCGDTQNEFWSHYTLENGPEKLKEMSREWGRRLPEYSEYSNFPLESWILVSEGVGAIDKGFLSEVYDYNLAIFDLDSLYEKLIDDQDKLVEECVSHSTFLNDLKEE